MDYHHQQGELNRVQAEGYYNYSLQINQVKARNFGWHTLEALDVLKKKKENSTKSYQELFSMVERLDAFQIIGVSSYDLTNEEAKKFVEHTLIAISILKKKFPDKSSQDVFDMVRGLNPAQARGVSEFDLTRKQVEDPNYGIHIIIAMRDMIKKGLARNHEDAIAKVGGLNKYYAGLVSAGDCTKEQIKDLNFTPESNTFNPQRFTQTQNSPRFISMTSFSGIRHIPEKGIINRRNYRKPNSM